MRVDTMSAWIDQSHIVLPGFLDQPLCDRMRAICDRIYGQWQQENPPGFSTNMAFLTDQRYFTKTRSGLIDLLNLIGGRAVTDPLAEIAGEPVRFHNTQYFAEQVSAASPYIGAGAWHRDTQFEAPDLALEKKRRTQTQSAHFRIAFEDDDNLEIVPGSGCRWDTDEELAIRRPPDTGVWERTPQTTSNDMPGAHRIVLNAGDAAIFDAWSIHRGHYHMAPVRRTLDVIYAWGPKTDWAAPASFWFQRPDILKELSPDAGDFFATQNETASH